MKFALLCDRGCEEFAAQEIKNATIKEGYILFEADKKEIPNLCKNQLASRILAFIAQGTMENPEDAAVEQLKTFDYTPFIKDGSFKVECHRIGEHEFQAREVEESIGALIYETKEFPVKLKNPDMQVFCQIVDESFVIGVDLCGYDLGKREYKVFHTRKSLRATIAYAAITAAGYTGKEILVDPFANDGAIAIEAALKASKISVNKYKHEIAYQKMPLGKDLTSKEEEPKKTQVTGFADSISLLKIARSNAKLAGVDKVLNLTKNDVEWLDTKFEKESVDLIVTLPPSSGKNTPLKAVEKLQDSLFYQARYVLKKTGAVLLVSEKRAEHLNAAEQHKFRLEKEYEVWMGESRVNFLYFKK